MSPTSAPSEPALTSLDQLLEPFHAAEKPRDRWRVGTEAEKFGLDREGKPVQYEGPGGVKTLLEGFVARHGWTSTPEYEGAALIALRRGGASITLEPGAQLELSGAPLDTIHQTCAELRGHMAELRALSEPHGIHWLGLGFHPLATQAELPWVPKLRYGVMKEYLPTKGSMALDMMRRTSTVQANMDYADEADALRKLRVSLRLQPLATAMFANSPWVEGRATGERSHRARVWLHMDPDRTGLLPFMLEEGASYRTYVEWALDVPMFLVKRGKELHRNTGQTFRSFMDDGFQGLRATRADWETHLNTLFPEARLKSTLEVRGTDSQPQPRICSVPALWKGLLYDERALAAADALTESWDAAELESIRPAIAERALAVDFAGKTLLDWAREVLEIAEGGLQRLGNLDGAGRDESVFLGPLRELLEAGDSPADVMLRAIGETPTADELLTVAHA
ncbi:MAG: glutamate--cysteine ligase [Sandaracinus sp.]|nr:glutamate--cysteine ligase [Sandaracinus sp.]|tara:strand:- start:443 stop:1798 length:1356 start_codon:yes stop_codon:yes gene_type:complete